jgi:hypothetical protein
MRMAMRNEERAEPSNNGNKKGKELNQAKRLMGKEEKPIQERRQARKQKEPNQARRRLMRGRRAEPS